MYYNVNVKFIIMKTLSSILIILVGFSLNSYSGELNVGDDAPDFKAKSVDETVWNLRDHIGEKNIVVYFYPAAMTGGCTAQACAYRDFRSDLESVDALVVGISGDNIEGLKVFKNANDLNFTLLSDESGEIAEKFGVPTRDGGSIEREVDGKIFELTRGTTASRWTFIIDKKGKIVYKNEDVNASSDPEEVVNFLKNNS